MTAGWHERATEEKHELGERIEALETFIDTNDEFRSMDPKLQDLLEVQLYHMHGYHDALRHRLSRAHA